MSHWALIVSGAVNLAGITGRVLGCALLIGSLSMLKVWMLWVIGSLFLISNVAPTGTITTWGTKRHLTWSNTSLAAVSTGLPLAMFVRRTTAFFTPLSAPAI